MEKTLTTTKDLTQQTIIEAIILAVSKQMTENGWCDAHSAFKDEMRSRCNAYYTLSYANVGQSYPCGANKENTLFAGIRSILCSSGYLGGISDYKITPLGEIYLKKLLEEIKASEGYMDASYATLTGPGGDLLMHTAENYGIDDLFPIDDDEAELM